ncbi:zinc uptake protein ZrgA [Vibrio campbellii]
MPSKHALALVIGLSLAATANAEEYRQHEAHVHGHVEFNIAQDGKDLLIEITSPGADVVGFEHAPENAEQEKALGDAVAALKNTDQLFAINKQAKCVIEDVHVSHTLGQDSHEGHEHHDEHEGHDHEHGGHGEFTAEYRYHCDSVADLNSINTTWFKQFPATESISANLFTDTTQSATSLSKDNAKIAIK